MQAVLEKLSLLPHFLSMGYEQVAGGKKYIDQDAIFLIDGYSSIQALPRTKNE
ncbi:MULTISPECIES: hypothetical protein [Virgibacillus]|uniref:hypothetical protein n=1 Tax=Virgibacillus TaxID=84406 RepID=UPI001592605A|nr:MULTISPECIES: hypothetical protein [Virgibacillus]